MRHVVAAMTAVAVLAGATAAMGQGVEVSEIENPTTSSEIFARAGYGHRFDGDLDGPSTLASDDARGEFGGTIAFNDRIRWMNFVGYGFTNYDSEFVDGHIHNLSFASIVGWQLDPRWSLLFGPIISVAAQSDAEWSEAVSGGGVMGGVFSPMSNLRVGLALVTLAQFEENVSLLPVPLVDWQFAPQWQLHTGITEVAGRRGLGGNVTWTFVEPADLSTGIQFEHRRFRLNEGGARSDFIAEDESVPLYARVTVRIIRGLSADVLGGVAFAGELKLHDRHDNFRESRSYDPQPIFGVRLQYKLSGL